jgi:hypothetical protein
MAGNKTVATGADVAAFLEAVEPEAKRVDALQLDRIFREVSGFEPAMWGPTMIGYGRYHYVYPTGREGDFLATGFSPRAREFTVYIMPGYADFGEILDRIGTYRIGKSCLYFKRLSDIDEDVLRELIRAGLDNLHRIWPVEPS